MKTIYLVQSGGYEFYPVCAFETKTDAENYVWGIRFEIKRLLAMDQALPAVERVTQLSHLLLSDEAIPLKRKDPMLNDYFPSMNDYEVVELLYHDNVNYWQKTHD